MAAGSLTRLAPSRPLRWRPVARRLAYASPALLLAGSLGFLASDAPGPPRLQVTVLNVGQGDAILIETPSGRDVLIDGGPGRAVLRGLGAELPWRDRSIDLVVLSHPQADHAVGLLDVFHRFDVARVALPHAVEDDALAARAVRDAAVAEGAKIQRVGAGTTFDLGDGVRLEALAPADGSDLAGNDASVVLRLAWRDVSFLLTGDIEARGERALLRAGVDVRATVLKIAHHGSATSTTSAFLRAVQPSVAVISSGEGNRYGHPDAGVVERVSALSRVYNTAIAGTVRFSTDGARLWVDTDR
jgi:competence protein ComEC